VLTGWCECGLISEKSRCPQRAPDCRDADALLLLAQFGMDEVARGIGCGDRDKHPRIIAQQVGAGFWHEMRKDRLVSGAVNSLSVVQISLRHGNFAALILSPCALAIAKMKKAAGQSASRFLVSILVRC